MVESFEIEHHQLPDGLVKELKLYRNIKNSMVSYKAMEKLVKISTEVLH